MVEDEAGLARRRLQDMTREGRGVAGTAALVVELGLALGRADTAMLDAVAMPAAVGAAAGAVGRTRTPLPRRLCGLSGARPDFWLLTNHRLASPTPSS